MGRFWCAKFKSVGGFDVGVWRFIDMCLSSGVVGK